MLLILSLLLLEGQVKAVACWRRGAATLVIETLQDEADLISSTLKLLLAKLETDFFLLELGLLLRDEEDRVQ